MLLCVVGNCLLFYCGCTGNCENCCGINGNASVSGSIKYKSDNKIDIKNKLEEVKIPAEGKIGNIQIVNAEFAGGINYVQICSEEDKQELDKIKESINPTVGTYLSAYVEVKKEDNNVVVYFIYCKDANSKQVDNSYNGLFDGSKATKIEILSCGSKIENMSYMFYNCHSLTNIIFHDNVNTENVTDMSCMFYYCSSLTELDLSKFNTNKVKNMSYMFNECSSLTNINLSNFKTNNVTDMSFMFYGCSNLTELNLSSFNTNEDTYISNMFYNCFPNKATLICKASTIQKIADDAGNSRLSITNDKKAEINDIICDEDNQGEVYKCSVKRVGSNPEITEVEEYQPHQ